MAYTTLRSTQKYFDVPINCPSVALTGGVLAVSTLCLPKGFLGKVQSLQLKALKGADTNSAVGTLYLGVFLNYVEAGGNTPLEPLLSLTLPYDCSKSVASREVDQPLLLTQPGNYSIVATFIGTGIPVFTVEGTVRLVSDITEDDTLTVSVLGSSRWLLPNLAYPHGSGTVPACASLVETTSGVSGPAGLLFLITVRIRGVVERIKITNGVMITPNVAIGGTNTDSGNDYRLEVSDPPLVAHVNAHSDGPYLLACQAIDHEFSFLARVGATVSLIGDSADGYQLDNTLYQAQIPELYAGVYPGQFAQMDVLGVELIYQDV